MAYDPCGLMNAQRVCNAQQGLPTEPFTQVGTGTPEGVVAGIVVGLHQFWRTDGGGIMYVFNGTVGTKTGWVAI